MYRFKFKYEFFDEDPRLTLLRQERKVLRKTDPSPRRRTTVEIYWNNDLLETGTVTQYPTDPDVKILARKRAVAEALRSSDIAKKVRAGIWKTYFEQHVNDKQHVNNKQHTDDK